MATLAEFCHVSDKTKTNDATAPRMRLYILDFLTAEVMAARMVYAADKARSTPPPPPPPPRDA